MLLPGLRQLFSCHQAGIGILMEKTKTTFNVDADTKKRFRADVGEFGMTRELVRFMAGAYRIQPFHYTVLRSFLVENRREFINHAAKFDMAEEDVLSLISNVGECAKQRGD